MSTSHRSKTPQRLTLPPDLKAERLALFADGAQPSKDAYEALLAKIQSTPGCGAYTRKDHSNYRTHINRERTRRAALRHCNGGDAPAPTSDDSLAHPAPTREPDALFATRTAADVLRLCDPAVRTQIIAERNPAAEQFLRWERVAGVPAVELFWAWQATHRVATARTALQNTVEMTADSDVARELVASGLASPSPGPFDGQPPFAASFGGWPGDVQDDHFLDYQNASSSFI